MSSEDAGGNLQSTSARRDPRLRLFAVTLLISVFCNAYICCKIAVDRATPGPSLAEQEEIARALFVWDVRRSTSVLPSTGHEIVLSTREGRVIYEFDQQSRTLTRTAGSETFTLLSGVESASFLFCQRPKGREQARGANAGMVVLNWRTRDARGLQPERSAAACL